MAQKQKNKHSFLHCQLGGGFKYVLFSPVVQVSVLKKGAVRGCLGFFWGGWNTTQVMWGLFHKPWTFSEPVILNNQNSMESIRDPLGVIPPQNGAIGLEIFTELHGLGGFLW